MSEVNLAATSTDELQRMIFDLSGYLSVKTDMSLSEFSELLDELKAMTDELDRRYRMRLAGEAWSTVERPGPVSEGDCNASYESRGYIS